MAPLPLGRSYHLMLKFNFNQMIGIIRRSFTSCTADIVIPLYKAFVHQHLEFGVAFWGGFIMRRQLHAIEKVQMRATDIVESVKVMPYKERLRQLKLPTMTYRCVRGLMMEVWKHINSYDTVYQISSVPPSAQTFQL